MIKYNIAIYNILHYMFLTRNIALIRDITDYINIIMNRL
jgi:hypothetical protein